MDRGERLLMVGCGILRAEVRQVVESKGWPIDLRLVDSALHCELDRLADTLKVSLSHTRGRKTIVFYGCCHPMMDDMLRDWDTFRTTGQNCVEMLVGRELFEAELEAGAFFLLEEWANRWETILARTFGTKNFEVIGEIFRTDRTNLLCVRTPCSGDFTAAAARAGELVGLPIRWVDVGLEHLEAVLAEAVARRLSEP